MKKPQVAVIGLGRLGSACADRLIDDEHLALAGIVRRPGTHGRLPGRLRRFPAAEHIRDLPAADMALVCVPADAVLGTARELLQAHIPIVECASLEGHALDTHYEALDIAAKNHRTVAVLGAGWNPGVLHLFSSAFEMLIPRGHNAVHRHPGMNLHHSAAVALIKGVKGALTGEYHGAGGTQQRYVYVEPEAGADFSGIRESILADPLFADEETTVFQMDKLSELEDEDSQGIVLERRAASATGAHASLLLEARFEPAAFAAQVMIDAARKISALPHGAHRYALEI